MRLTLFMNLRGYVLIHLVNVISQKCGIVESLITIRASVCNLPYVSIHIQTSCILTMPSLICQANASKSPGVRPSSSSSSSSE